MVQAPTRQPIHPSVSSPPAMIAPLATIACVPSWAGGGGCAASTTAAGRRRQRCIKARDTRSKPLARTDCGTPAARLQKCDSARPRESSALATLAKPVRRNKAAAAAKARLPCVSWPALCVVMRAESDAAHRLAFVDRALQNRWRSCPPGWAHRSRSSGRSAGTRL